jgi:hypothetical protein
LFDEKIGIGFGGGTVAFIFSSFFFLGGVIDGKRKDRWVPISCNHIFLDKQIEKSRNLEGVI